MQISKAIASRSQQDWLSLFKCFWLLILPYRICMNIANTVLTFNLECTWKITLLLALAKIDSVVFFETSRVFLQIFYPHFKSVNCFLGLITQKHWKHSWNTYDVMWRQSWYVTSGVCPYVCLSRQTFLIKTHDECDERDKSMQDINWFHCALLYC